MSPSSPWRILVVPESSMSSFRLDAFVARQVDGVSKRTAKQMAARGDITVDGRRAKGGQVVASGARVEIWREPVSAVWSPRPDGDLRVVFLYVDDDLLVVSKPSGIPSVPLHPEEGGTLAGAVVHRFPECGTLGRRPGDGGLLQRLDIGTSGAVVAARKPEVFDRMLASQRAGLVEKHYLALVRGGRSIPSEVTFPLGPVGEGGARMGPVSDGRPARTAFRVIAETESFKWVAAVLHRGVRHQVRAHLAAVENPIVGDAVYDPGPSPDGVSRPFLHAHRLVFDHPTTGEKVVIEAPIPKELSKFVEKNLIISF